METKVEKIMSEPKEGEDQKLEGVKISKLVDEFKSSDQIKREIAGLEATIKDAQEKMNELNGYLK